VPPLQLATPLRVLTVPAALDATAGEDTIFPLALDGTDGVPARSIIAISGLPQGSTLSNGRPHGETEWNLNPDEIGDLHLLLPNTAAGQSKLTIKLIAPDDAVLADTEMILLVRSVSEGSLQRAAEAGGADAAADLGHAEPDLIGTGILGVKPQLTEAQSWEERAQSLGATNPQEIPSNLKADETQKAPPHFRTESRTQVVNDDLHTNWIHPSVFVNLREEPSPSAAVVSVVAKGTKLRVLGRKRRWLQVTNPANSEKGWIYTGHVVTVARVRHKRTISSEAQPKSESQHGLFDGHEYVW
jgi:hypothetical protein